MKLSVSYKERESCLECSSWQNEAPFEEGQNKVNIYLSLEESLSWFVAVCWTHHVEIWPGCHHFCPQDLMWSTLALTSWRPTSTTTGRSSRTLNGSSRFTTLWLIRSTSPTTWSSVDTPPCIYRPATWWRSSEISWTAPASSSSQLHIRIRMWDSDKRSMLIFPFQLNKELKRSGARYRGLNLYLDPFYLPPPICHSLDADHDHDYIMLWDLSTISLQKPSTST